MTGPLLLSNPTAARVLDVCPNYPSSVDDIALGRSKMIFLKCQLKITDTTSFPSICISFISVLQNRLLS